MPKDTTRPAPVSRANAEHYRWGNDCDGWHLVKDEHLSVIEEFIPSGGREIRHYHQKAQQFFYVLSGEVIMEVDGKNTLLATGTGMRIATCFEAVMSARRSIPCTRSIARK